MLKGLPEFTNNPELRELALGLQRDICIENPNVTFSDIVGLDKAKALLKEAVMLPLKYPQLFVTINFFLLKIIVQLDRYSRTLERSATLWTSWYGQGNNHDLLSTLRN